MSNPEENQAVKDLEAVAEIDNEEARDLSSYVPERHRKPGETAFSIIATVFGV